MQNKPNPNRLETLKDDLKSSLSITDVFERYFYPVKRRGNSSEALCPFHNDKEYGNFYINEAKGFFKCFNCGSKGDIFSLVQKAYGCEFPEAIWILAKDYGLVTEEDFKNQKISFDKNYKSKKELLSNKKEKENKVELSELASEDKIELIYNIFIELAYLKKEDKEYLMKTRELSEDRINKDYFTMPYCSSDFMSKLISKLEEVGLTEQDLLGVPGFYLSKNGSVMFKSYRGIGIRIKNVNQTRIQIRLRKPFLNKSNKYQRYIWFSSQHDFKGCGSGSPVDILYPSIDKEKMKRIVFLTEGKFKSEMINKYFDSISLSIQGITSWQNKIKPQIQYIQKDAGIKGIFICYDADMSSNIQVYYQCKEMVKHELDMFHKNNIFIVTWDASKGKGIDDLINNGYKDEVKKIEFYKYEKIYDEFLDSFPKDEEGKLLNKEGNIITKEELYDEYMVHIFPKI